MSDNQMAEHEAAQENLQGDDIVEIDGEEVRAAAKKRKRARKLSSDVWQFFEIKVDKHTKKREVKCKACGKDYAYNSAHGTGNMKRHIPMCPRKNVRDVGQSLLKGSIVKFDIDVFRELFASAVVMHDLPFHCVDWVGIKALLCYLKPDLKIISRNTCRADCLKIFKREKNRVKALLESSLGRICLTSDCWSSLTTDGFICLTGHFIDKDWILQKKILNFCYLPPPHSGVALCEKIHNFLCGWQIDAGVFSITLDNAAANDVCADLLKNLLVAKNGLVNQGDFFHVRCSAHILNLIVQEGLKEIDGSIAKIRESIKYVKGSQARKVKFMECVRLCNLESKKGLRQDVPTRWNSTYLMLECSLYYQNAFTHLQLSDSNFKHCPTFEEWEKVQKICKFLKVFNDITCIFSGSKYPTANMYFPLVFTAHLTLYQNLNGDDEYMSLMATRMNEKFQKYWAEYSKVMAIAAILDPRFKFNFVQWSYKKLYGDDDGFVEAMKIKAELFRLYSIYANSVSAESVSFVTSDANPTSQLMRKMGSDEAESSLAIDMWKEFDTLESDDIDSQKSELDYYLDEPRMDRKVNLDILAYWKGNQFRYPKIAALARDILAIPVTTVASESAFSNSGRVLDQYRSSLKPDVVEALVCARDWLLGQQESNEVELEEIERDLMELSLDAELRSNETGGGPSTVPAAD